MSGPVLPMRLWLCYRVWRRHGANRLASLKATWLIERRYGGWRWRLP